MTSQEESMLNSLVERVNSTQLSEKDTAAESLLARGFSNNPDAVYVLAQSVLVQNIALEQAKSQLTQAQQQIQQLQEQAPQQPAKATSFLGGLFGHRDPQPPAQQSGYQPVYSPQGQPEYQTPYNPAPSPYQGQAYPPPPQYPPQQQYAPPQYAASQQYAPPQYVAAPPQQPSFLRGAAQTAAGVAAGALAFEGVESLLHGGFGHPGMGMGMGGWGMPGVGYGMGPGGGFERPVEETVVNNYYDSPGSEHEHRMEGGDYGRQDYGRDFDRGGEEHGRDSSWDDNSGSSSDFNENSDFDSGGGGGGDFGSGGDDNNF